MQPTQQIKQVETRQPFPNKPPIMDPGSLFLQGDNHWHAHVLGQSKLFAILQLDMVPRHLSMLQSSVYLSTISNVFK